MRESGSELVRWWFSFTDNVVHLYRNIQVTTVWVTKRQPRCGALRIGCLCYPCLVIHAQPITGDIWVFVSVRPHRRY